MNISLTPTLEKFVQDKVATGLYNSVSEVIREALRLLAAKEGISQSRIAQLNQDIEVGLSDLEQGNYRDGHSVMNEMIERSE